MSRLLAALAATILLVTSAQSSDRADVLSVVRQWIDANNKGDMKSFVALCTEQGSIVDDFPPYQWVGSGACSKWWNDNAALAKSEGITDATVILGQPLQVSVTGDHAYVVTRDAFTYKAKGKPMKQTDAIHTLVLEKTASGWRIKAETWAAIAKAMPESAAK